MSEIITADSSSMIVDFDERDLLSAFFGPRAEAYLKISEAAKGRNYFRMTPVSLLLLFLPLTWLLYRKMYWVTILYIVLFALIGFFFPQAHLYGTGAFAIIGPSLYVQIARAKVKKLREKFINHEQLLAAVKRAGGVSIPGAVLGTVITVVSILAILREGGLLTF